MSIIPQDNRAENALNNTINRFFKKFKISMLLKSANCNKERGIQATKVFRFIFQLVFSHKNLYRSMQSNDIDFKKDVVYRFINSVHINWNKFVVLLATRVINFITTLTSDERINVLILDNTIYKRNRSKLVELLTRVQDHSDNRYYRGFNLLTLGWSDGNTFLPFAFRLLSSFKSRTRICKANSNIDKRTNGYKRRVSAVMKTTDAAIQLIKDAKKACIDAKYLLFDSWFSFPSFISDVRKEGFHTISVLKDMSRVFYRYKGRLRRLSKVYAIINTKRFDEKDPHIASVIVDYKNKEGKWEPLKICFVREKCNKRNWIAVATTDISLSPEEVVRIYSKRWNIEVFFKVCKSNLRLAKEFQSRSFDSVVAQVAIVFTRYLMLSYENRVSLDDRSIGDLFYACCDELQDIKFLEALFLILNVLKSLLRDKLILSEQAVKEALDYFFNSIPSFISSKLAFANCES